MHYPFASVVLFMLGGVALSATELGIDGTQFTLNQRPTFLLGISYYGALGASGESTRQSNGGAARTAYGVRWQSVARRRFGLGRPRASHTLSFLELKRRRRPAPAGLCRRTPWRGTLSPYRPRSASSPSRAMTNLALRRCYERRE